MKKTIRTLFYTVTPILFLCAVFLFGNTDAARTALSTPVPPHLEIPRCVANTGVAAADVAETAAISDHEIHAYEGFTLCYRESFELAEWVAYELTRAELEKRFERTDRFTSDPFISTGSALPTDYRGSGFDRGHLAPAADMRFSAQAMDESFYMSNMAPQTPALNRVTWAHLEALVRRLADTYGTVWVVSGPVLDKADFPRIGASRVAVPEYFYKVLLIPIGAADNGLDTASNELDAAAGTEFVAVGFIIPNENPQKDYTVYAVSVDEVEKRVGLDFFSALDDSVEEKIESMPPSSSIFIMNLLH